MCALSGYEETVDNLVIKNGLGYAADRINVVNVGCSDLLKPFSAIPGAFDAGSLPREIIFSLFYSMNGTRAILVKVEFNFVAYYYNVG